jgi:hypothetical protein
LTVATIIHRGPIPGTNVGHHWFTAANGQVYGIGGHPHGINTGWSYEVLDQDGRLVDDSIVPVRRDPCLGWLAPGRSSS